MYDHHRQDLCFFSWLNIIFGSDRNVVLKVFSSYLMVVRKNFRLISCVYHVRKRYRLLLGIMKRFKCVCCIRSNNRLTNWKFSFKQTFITYSICTHFNSFFSFLLLLTSHYFSIQFCSHRFCYRWMHQRQRLNMLCLFLFVRWIVSVLIQK